MYNQNITHVGFADETNWNDGRFRGVSLVTAPNQKIPYLLDQLDNIYSPSNIREFKWTNIQDDKHLKLGRSIVDFVCDAVANKVLRVDTLYWDTNDKRHKIKHRDDLENMQRMYFHLCNSVLRKRWGTNTNWILHPDEMYQMNWSNIKFYVNQKQNKKVIQTIAMQGFIPHMTKDIFSIESIIPLTSHSNKLIQLADLFAGLSTFAQEQSLKFIQWQQQTKTNQLTFLEHDSNYKLTNREKYRFELLHHLLTVTNRRKIHVKVDHKVGLKSSRISQGLSFWLYKPQHSHDKAPTKHR